MTATDPGAIPEPVRKRLAVIELPGYTEQEKVTIGEQYLLKRPFDEPGGTSAACLGPEPASPLAAALDGAPDGLAVLVDQELSSFREPTLSSGPPSPAPPRHGGRRRARAMSDSSRRRSAGWSLTIRMKPAWRT